MTRTLNRHAPLLLTLAAAGLLAAAYAFEHLGGLPPCELCWWQRYAHMAAVPFGFLAWGLDPRPWARAYSGSMLLLMAGVFATGAGIAGYHVGVEQGWWNGPAACSAVALEGSVEDIFDQLLAAPVVRCDEVAWSLFGISMAGYNAALSLGLALYAGWAAHNRLRSD